MRWVARAALATAMLGCVQPGASADEKPHWLKDPANSCAVYDANARPGDTVTWSGVCADGLASGPGTAVFTNTGTVFESFTGTFAQGTAQDGHVLVHWGDGWSYDGNTIHGQFNGAGILINDRRDRFEGAWRDGKMNGHGTVLRANGERYEGEWKDDLPNGVGILTHADGSRVEGQFADGQLIPAKIEAAAIVPDAKSDVAPQAEASEKPSTEKPSVAPHGFENISGKTLAGIDGSHIALTLIEGGIERQITAPDGAAQKTAFTFMNDRLGTVVEDGGPAAGANVTGFFRLTDAGVDVRYADGRAEILTTSNEGGVLMSQISADGGTSCRAWYPDGHVFSEEEKKAALAAYAGKLGLQAAPKTSACAQSPLAGLKPHAGSSAAHTAFHPQNKLAALEPVAVRESVVHTIDAPLSAADALMPELPAPVASPGQHDASHCLKVESDGHNWGFRNSCGFAVQFAYCLMQGGGTLTDCGKPDGVNSVTGSVAAGGFGALSADNSLGEKNADHDFRWVACDGGAGEVVPHLDHAEPPGGHCDRADPITANAH